MNDLISRQVAIEMLMDQNVIMDGSEYHNGFNAGVNRAQEVIRNLPTVQSNVPVINVGDMISRQAATTIPVMPKEHRHYQTNNLDDAYEQGWTDLQECIENLPTVQPTITHEQAIDYLHKTGWLQNHDRILTESKMMMPVQPIIYCEKCLYKKICSWKNQGATFCSFGERGDSE